MELLSTKSKRFFLVRHFFVFVKGLGARNLKLFRQFYLVYPQIGSVIPTVLAKLGFSAAINFDVLKLQSAENKTNGIVHSGNAQFKSYENALSVSPHTK